MSDTTDLAALFERDLKRLHQQVATFTDEETLWALAPGVSNSAGNLMLHLEGNLREYIGRVLGGFAYHRVREDEFGKKGVSRADLAARIAEIGQMVPGVILHLTEDRLQALYPESVLTGPLSTRQFLMHLYGHFSYHLGQIDYLRRILTAGSALTYAQL
jgi:hypothetical protein